LLRLGVGILRSQHSVFLGTALLLFVRLYLVVLRNITFEV
jgi:hypothetical protein